MPSRYLGYWVLLSLIGLSTLAFGGSTNVVSPKPQYFYNRADFPAGNSPDAVAIADVNNDGRPDLVAVNFSDGTASVFLGQPDGTFGAKTDYPTGPGPVALVTGDFNNDGKVDLAVVDACAQGGRCISILLGNGDGTFAPKQDFPTSPSPIGITTGDFNKDGKLDLAVTGTMQSGSTTVGVLSILLGNGDGTFQAQPLTTLGLALDSVVAADFNADGDVDLAVADSGSSSNSIYVLLGKGDGTFQTPVSYTSNGSPSGLAVGDFNGDKIPDLVVTHDGVPWTVTVLKGNGDGTFQAEQQIATGDPTSQVVAADLNGDGKLDFVLPMVNEGGVLIFLGDGDGTFQPPLVYSTGQSNSWVAIGDVNGDGKTDLVATNSISKMVTVLLGNGDGTFSPRRDLPQGPTGSVPLNPQAAVIGDFNADGIPDIALSEGNPGNPTVGSVTVELGKGNGQFQSPVSTNVNGASAAIAAADFNGDGHLDIAIANGNGAAVMLGNGDGTFGAPLQVVNTIGSQARGLVVGDFNNDGKQDLIVLGNGFLQSNPIYVLLGNGDGTFQAPKQFWSSTTIPMAIAAGDFNGDGKLDLVADVNPSGIAVMLGNGDGTFQTPVMYPTDDLPTGLTVADLNGDGVLDIVATALKVDVYLGKGDGTFASPVFFSSNAPQEVSTGDFFGDGKTDLAVTELGSVSIGDLAIFRGNGDGTFQPPVEIADAAPTGAPLSVGDLNRDGVSDVVVAGGQFGSLFLSTPIASLSPRAVNFGSVGEGNASPPTPITLSNVGNAPMVLSNLTVSPNFSVSNGCGGSVALQTSCTLNVSFTPTGSGTDTGVLTVIDNAPGGQQTVPLSGSGHPDFSLAVASGSSSSATVSAGGTANYQLTAAPFGGFNQAISFTCSGAPAGANCSVSPNPITLDGTNSAAISVQVTTAMKSVALPRFTNEPFSDISWFMLCLAAAILMGVFCLLDKKLRKLIPYRRATLGALALLLTILIGASSCGSGQGKSGPTTSTLTVTGSSSSGGTTSQHSIALTLTVN